MLAQSDGLAFIRGKWVEVDPDRLGRTLEQFEAIERRAVTEGLSFGEAMRMLAGAGIAEGGAPERPTLTGAKRSLVGGWRRRLRPYVAPKGSRVSIPVDPFGVRSAPISRRECNGSICSRNSSSGPALQMTWGSERRSRSCRCCWFSGAKRTPSINRVFWSRLPRCWPIGLLRLRDLRQASKRSSLIHRQRRPTKLKTDGAGNLADVDLVITSYGYLARVPWLE